MPQSNRIFSQIESLLLDFCFTAMVLIIKPEICNFQGSAIFRNRSSGRAGNAIRRDYFNLQCQFNIASVHCSQMLNNLLQIVLHITIHARISMASTTLYAAAL